MTNFACIPQGPHRWSFRLNMQGRTPLWINARRATYAQYAGQPFLYLSSMHVFDFSCVHPSFPSKATRFPVAIM